MIRKVDWEGEEREEIDVDLDIVIYRDLKNEKKKFVKKK